MENKRIRDIEGYEAFKAECSFFKCEEEYPGWTGDEKYGIITGLSKEELEARFPQFIKAMSPYVLLDLEYGQIRAEAMVNDDKFEKRSKFSDHLFEMDEEAESMHPELSVPDHLTEMIEEQEENERHLNNSALCCATLQQMSELHKRRLVMRHVLKMKVNDIAEVEGCSESAIVQSLKYAEKKFREIYDFALYFDTPNSIHYEGVESILNRIAASNKTNESNEENQNEQ